jgi:hypothetical protein
MLLINLISWLIIQIKNYLFKRKLINKINKLEKIIKYVNVNEIENELNTLIDKTNNFECEIMENYKIINKKEKVFDKYQDIRKIISGK